MNEDLIQNDAVIFGILMLILGAVFYTSDSKLVLEKILWLGSIRTCLLFSTVVTL